MNRWDQFYLDICNQVSANSQCLSRKVGAILVRDKTILSTGYNGPPRGTPHCNKRHLTDRLFVDAAKEKGIEVAHMVNLSTCPRQILKFKSGEGLEWCIAGHGERNAIVNAAREGISTKGATMYMNCGIPCTPCLVEIINAGIHGIVCDSDVRYDKMQEYLLETSRLRFRLFDKPYL